MTSLELVEVYNLHTDAVVSAFFDGLTSPDNRVSTLRLEDCEIHVTFLCELLRWGAPMLTTLSLDNLSPGCLDSDEHAQAIAELLQARTTLSFVWC